jgi:adenosylhomocysteine nucleosidase
LFRPTLVLCPLAPEAKALLSALAQKGYGARQDSLSATAQNYWSIEDLGIYVAVGGHGKAQFAAKSQWLLQQLKDSQALICAGCAGGLDPKLQVGDVVVATQTVEHDYQLKFVERPTPHFTGNPDLLSHLQNSNPSGESFRTHYGIVASGDEDVLDPQRAEEIRQKTQALAVAWEGAGGARSAQVSGHPYMEIRGITDMCNDNTVPDFKQNLSQAMTHIAQLLTQLSAH